jgi:hypothetical protein
MECKTFARKILIFYLTAPESDVMFNVVKHKEGELVCIIHCKVFARDPGEISPGAGKEGGYLSQGGFGFPFFQSCSKRSLI